MPEMTGITGRERGRSVVKRMAESALVAAGLPALGRARLRGRGLVLAYHNIVPEGGTPAGDRSLHLPRSAFAAQLDALGEDYRVVPLPEIVREDTGDGRPRVAITFDDAYRGAVTCGVDELVRRGLPATIFVCPGRLEGHRFWWDEVLPEAAGLLPDEFRKLCLGRFEGRGAEIRRWAEEGHLPLARVPEHAFTATEAELGEVAARPGITLGSHSWSHPNLARLDSGELSQELEGSLRWLSERFESTVPWLAYPYGESDGAVEEAARSAGYDGALRIDGGWVGSAPEDLFRLPRLNIPAGLSAAGFELRVSGVLS